MYFSGYGLAGGGSWAKAEYEVEGADARSFKVRRVRGLFGGKKYATDRNHAYWHASVIGSADVETFKPIDADYSVDAAHIFFRDSVLSAADPGSLRVLADEYALDARNVYFRGKILPGADSRTFETLGYYYAKDRNAVYDAAVVMDEVADPATFRQLGRPEKEVNSWPGLILTVILSGGDDFMHDWACDKDYYYRDGRRVEGADRATFTLLDDGYTDFAKDRYRVFYCGSPRPFIVEGADAETFELLSKRRNFARDKNNYYEEGRIISYEYAVEEGLIRAMEYEREHPE